jgi:hypothetical protein
MDTAPLMRKGNDSSFFAELDRHTSFTAAIFHNQQTGIWRDSKAGIAPESTSFAGKYLLRNVHPRKTAATPPALAAASTTVLVGQSQPARYSSRCAPDGILA